MQDEDELVRALGIPTLGDLDELAGPPDVREASRASDSSGHPGPLPPLPPMRVRPHYMAMSRARTATLVLLVWAATLIGFGFWQTHVANAALDPDSPVGVNAWERVWRPLIYFTTIVALLAGGLFWLAARVVARVMRWELGSSGIGESLAVVTTPLALPLLVAVLLGTTDMRVLIPATAGAFTAACLMVPGFLGLPLARGLAAAAICLAAASPGYVLGTLIYSDMSHDAARDDDARIAAATARHKQYALEAATQPAAAMPGPSVPASNPTARQTIERAKETFQYQTGVPVAPPPVVAPAQAQPSVEAPSVKAPVAAAPAVPAPVVAPDTMWPATRPSQGATVVRTAGQFVPWRQGGLPYDVVWRQGGRAIATVSIDTLGNHLLNFWSSRDLERIGSVRVGGGTGISYAICPEGQTLLKIVDGIVPLGEIWSIPEQRRLFQFALAPEQMQPVALGFLDKQTAAVLVKIGADYAVDLLDIRRPYFRKRIGVSVPSTPQNAPSRPFSAANIALSEDGKSIAVVTNQFRLHLVDTATGLIRQQWPLSIAKADGVETRCVAFSPDGASIAVLVEDAARSAIFAVTAGSGEITAAGFSEPLWRQANAPRALGRHVGRSLDWADDNLLLCNGELLIDLWSGSVIESLHPRAADKPREVAPTAQFPLGDGSFLLMHDAERSQLQRLWISSE